MKVHDYKKLLVWQKSIVLAKQLYTLTENFPKTEMWGLVSQMKRSAVSIPSNIAEGSRRKTSKDFCQFLSIALGSASELETQLLLSIELDMVKSSRVQGTLDLLEEIMKMLNKLIESKSSY